MDWGGLLGTSCRDALLRCAGLLSMIIASRALDLYLSFVFASAFVFCIPFFWIDLLGWYDTILFLVSDNLKPAVEYRKEISVAPDGESYAVWWSRRGTSRRVWVLLPGGMSDGSTSCQQSCVRALPTCDGVCVIHNPGQGGTRIQKRFGPGLTDTTYVVHFLTALSDANLYDRVIIVGLSAGGMTVPKLAADPIVTQWRFAVHGVMLGSPDFIRHTFEDQSTWLFRLDVFFTLWFYLVTCRSGLVAQLPSRLQYPWIPTWAGYMKPATEAAMTLGKQQTMCFEQLENEHFSGYPRLPLLIRVLRIHGENDSIVRPEVLLRHGMSNLDFWWTKRGGHCGQWRCYHELAIQISDWEMQSKSKSRAKEIRRIE